MTFLPLGNHVVAQMEKIKLQSVELISFLAFFELYVRRVNCTICLFTFVIDKIFFVVEDFTKSRKFLVVSIINSLRSFLAAKEFSWLEKSRKNKTSTDVLSGLSFDDSLEFVTKENVKLVFTPADDFFNCCNFGPFVHRIIASSSPPND